MVKRTLVILCVVCGILAAGCVSFDPGPVPVEVVLEAMTGVWISQLDDAEFPIQRIKSDGSWEVFKSLDATTPGDAGSADFEETWIDEDGYLYYKAVITAEWGSLREIGRLSPSRKEWETQWHAKRFPTAVVPGSDSYTAWKRM